jgi:hypothetical protein
MAAQGSKMLLGNGQGPQLMRKARTQRLKVNETPPGSYFSSSAFEGRT